MLNPASRETIEPWLYAQGGWVSTEALCNFWQISERELRPRGRRAGLLEGFAISRSGEGGGYKHVARATDAEFKDYTERKRAHARAELQGVRLARRTRLEALRQRQPHQAELSLA